MPVDTSPVIPSADAWDRVSAVVRTVEGWPGDRRGTPGPYYPNGSETIWAKLGTKVTDGFNWKEQFRKIGDDNKPTWADADGGRTGDNSRSDDSEKMLAVELVPGGAGPGQVVLLQRATTRKKKASESDPDEWLARWVIVAPLPDTIVIRLLAKASGGGVYTAQILRPIDQDISPTSAFTSSNIGNLDSDTTVYALNLREEGQATHDLDPPGGSTYGYLPQLFVARFWRINTDKSVVVVFDGAQWRTCGT